MSHIGSLRERSKQVRLEQTEVIKSFVKYARNQGSSNAHFYYVSISRVVNKALCTSCGTRDELKAHQLRKLIILERSIIDMITTGMEMRLSYKNVFRMVKRTIGAS